MIIALSERMTDDEWALVEPFIPPPKPGGGKRKKDMRAVMNGVMYILSTGCQWRYLPKDFPPRSTSITTSFGGSAMTCWIAFITRSTSNAANGRNEKPKKMLGKRRDSCKIVASINLQLTELRMQ